MTEPCTHCEGVGQVWDDQTGQPDEPNGGRMVTCQACRGEGIEDERRGECDCGVSYDVASRSDHCAECGTCWEHCADRYTHQHENHETFVAGCHDCDLLREVDEANYGWMARVARNNSDTQAAMEADRELMRDEFHR